MCDRPFTGSNLFSPIHVRRLKVVWAGPSCRLTVGTATSAILANICCTTRGHSEWVLIPNTAMLCVCVGGKHSFLFSRRRQTGTSGVAGNLQANRPLGRTGNVVGLRGPLHNCATSHYGCAEGCDRQHRRRRQQQQRVAVTGPVGWIWGLRLMKGGARSGLRRGGSREGFVSQPCYAKNIEHLPPSPMWVCCHIDCLRIQDAAAAATFSVILQWVFKKCVCCCQQQRELESELPVRADAEHQHVAIRWPLVAMIKRTGAVETH